MNDPSPGSDPHYKQALRDLFLVGAAVGHRDSMKVAALTYDGIYSELGPPGTGYNPATLRDAAYRHATKAMDGYREAEERGGSAALKVEGWLPW